MKHCSLIVDIHHVRCSDCKVALRDELATHCPVCGGFFENVVSNHVGLAQKLLRKRKQSNNWSVRSVDNWMEPIELIGS